MFVWPKIGDNNKEYMILRRFLYLMKALSPVSVSAVCVHGDWVAVICRCYAQSHPPNRHARKQQKLKLVIKSLHMI